MRELKVEPSVRYRIVVQGVLDANWSDRLGGLEIVNFRADAGEALTILIGEVVDQAALLGVLNTLYDLRYSLLSVQRLENDSWMDVGESLGPGG